MSRQIVDFAVKKGAGIIKLERLTFAEQSDRFAKLIRYWGYAELQTMIKYKADLAGLKVMMVESRNTSRMCSKCGHTEEDNRKKQADFLCLKCGHKMNADLNAAINIARSKEISTSEEVES